MATKALQNLKGRGLYLSPVVLWELLLTGNELTREKLLFFAQHLCESDLLPSPEELLVNYIGAGCPLVEKQRPLISEGLFAVPWRDICAIKEKTLVLDRLQLQRQTTVLRDMGRLFQEFAASNCIAISTAPGIAATQVNVQTLLDHYRIIPPSVRDDVESVRHLRLVTFLALMFLCIGVCLDQATIEKFWLARGARSVAQRIDHLFLKFPKLILQGPLHQIAYMARFQSGGRHSRGLFFDSLHAVYSLYADMLISADEHFRTFREGLRQVAPHVKKIVHFDELELTLAERANPRRGSFILRG